MTAPPWGHKPPAVDDVYRYWVSPPPEQSPRVAYWVRRLDEGSWHLTARLAEQGWDFMADWLGVYLWEWTWIILPKCREIESRPEREARARAWKALAVVYDEVWATDDPDWWEEMLQQLLEDPNHAVWSGEVWRPAGPA
jgi:urease accessory protein UreF